MIEPAPTPPVNKRCTICASAGPFPRDRTRPDGLHSQCKECHRVRSAARRAANPKATRAANALSMRRARQRDPEKSRAALRRWYYASKDRRRDSDRARSRAWYAAQKHTGRWLVYSHVRRARKAAANGRASAAQIRARVDYFGGQCAYCGGPFQHVDHVIPLSRGGTNWPANLRPACAPCNLSKHTKVWL